MSSFVCDESFQSSYTDDTRYKNRLRPDHTPTPFYHTGLYLNACRVYKGLPPELLDLENLQLFRSRLRFLMLTKSFIDAVFATRL